MADIYTLFEIGVLGIGLCLAIYLLRWRDQRRVDHFRQTFEVTPNSLGPEPLLNFTRSLSSLPRPRFLGAISALSLEHYADHTGERFFVHVGFDHQVNVDQLLLEHTGVTLEPIDPVDDVVWRRKWDKAVELSIASPGKFLSRNHSHLTTPLRIMDAKAVAATMGAPFKNMAEGEAVVLQWQLYPDKPRKPTTEDKAKVEDHTFHLTCRLGAIGENPSRMLRDLFAPFHSVESHGAKFVKRLLLDVCGRINRRAGTWGFLIYLNAFELMALLSWPLDGSGKYNARRIAPTIAHDHPGEGMITIGKSNSPRMQDREVAISATGLLTHAWLMGPTFLGKSTLLENIAAGVMEADMGLFVIEPKGDLVRNIVNIVPPRRRDDVVWLNPQDDCPIGLNILAGDNPSRIRGHVVSMFKIYSGDAWGHQMARVLGNVMYTAAVFNEVAKSKDEELTLYDAKQLLVNKEYRHEIVGKISRQRHPDVIQEWRWLDEKNELVLDAPVTRIDAFIGDPLIRNIVGQRGGLDIDQLVRERKILLCPLPGALLGEENAAALGMLIWEMIWDAHLRRPADQREPNILMADEYQMYAGESLSKADPFALARSYGLGLCVANQFSTQLPRAVFDTVSKNAQNVITFAASPDEARAMKDHFGPLTAEDIQYLPQYTVAARVMGSAGRTPTVTLKTPPPPRPTNTAAYIINRSRHLYGRPVEEVQADLLTRHKAGEPKRRPKIGDIDE
jgi:hypothetical protein